MSRLVDLSGQRFGQWTAVERSAGLTKETRWLCRCDCGVERDVLAGNLKTGHSKHCGCFARERQVIHGAKRRRGESLEYRSWSLAKGRCNNPRVPEYANYGGRGIRMAPEWSSDFAAFLRDMGPRPTPEHSLDRYPDTNGPYAPGNCRWATPKEQGRNKRNNLLITIGGDTQCLAVWAERAQGHISRSAIGRRLRGGWTPERAVFGAAVSGRPS